MEAEGRLIGSGGEALKNLGPIWAHLGALAAIPFGGPIGIFELLHTACFDLGICNISQLASAQAATWVLHVQPSVSCRDSQRAQGPMDPNSPRPDEFKNHMA